MHKLLKNTYKSWKTTLLGVMAFLIILMETATAMWDNDPSTIANWNEVVEAFMFMIALFIARDGDKSSEDVGVVKQG